MKKYFLFLLIAVEAICLQAQPPNNVIFFGGKGAGSSQQSFSMASNAIYFGGTGDGFSQAANNSSSNSIFKGGEGDGINSGGNAAVPNSIYIGGEGDGFTFQSNNAIPNSIFRGSEGDGFSFTSNGALPNNIFTGGEGDGWHAVIFPMGPLPVKLLSFTARHSETEHLIKWATTEEINCSHFEVQRSANGIDFSTMAITSATGMHGGASYHYNVSQPWTGNNFYRLKMVDADGSFTYSNVVLLRNAGGLQWSVYPNPTADILYLRIPDFANSLAIQAAIYDGQGRLVLRPVLKAGTDNAIAVGTLPAGIYTLYCISGQQKITFRFIKE